MMINTNAHNVRILLLLVQPLCVSPSFICPDISYIGVPVQLICTGGTVNHRYYNTSGVEVARCGLTVGSCEPTNSTAYVISANQTALNITSVQISDAGKWTCKNGLNSNQSCNLTIANIPTYSITSDSATDAVDVYDGISLTVDIRGFYCSAAHNLTLQVGSVTLPLNMYLPETVTEPTNLNFTIPINVTESHFGDVELIFLCNDHQLNVSHRSVTQLQQNDSTKVSGNGVPTTLSVGAPTTEIPPKDVSTLLIVAAGVTSAVIIILIITIACCCCRCRKKALRSGNVGSATAKAVPSEPKEAGLRINPVYVASHAQVMERPLDSAAPSDPSTCLGGGDYPETRGEYVGLDRNAAQLSNIYEHLSSYEQIGNL